MISTDVDECQERTNNYHEMAQCNNTVGSFNCTCLQGFSGDGVDCFGITVDYAQNLYIPYALFITVNRSLWQGMYLLG